jgi:hypothetical protein
MTTEDYLRPCELLSLAPHRAQKTAAHGLLSTVEFGTSDLTCRDTLAIAFNIERY